MWYEMSHRVSDMDGFFGTTEVVILIKWRMRQAGYSWGWEMDRKCYRKE